MIHLFNSNSFFLLSSCLRVFLLLMDPYSCTVGHFFSSLLFSSFSVSFSLVEQTNDKRTTQRKLCDWKCGTDVSHMFKQEDVTSANLSSVPIDADDHWQIEETRMSLCSYHHHRHQTDGINRHESESERRTLLIFRTEIEWCRSSSYENKINWPLIEWN